MIIDRLEGEFAIVELNNIKFENLPKALLPDNAKEGDRISIIVDSNTKLEKMKKS